MGFNRSLGGSNVSNVHGAAHGLAIMLVAGGTAPACMHVSNLAPVTPEVMAMSGQGETEMVIETDHHAVQRVDKVVEHTQWFRRTTLSRTTEWEKYTYLEYQGPILCEAKRSPCTTSLLRGRQVLNIQGGPFALVPVGVGTEPLTMRVVRQRNDGALAFGIGAMALGGLATIMGIIQATTGHPRPDNVAPEEMPAHGLTVAGVGAGVTIGGYLITTLWGPGEISVTPTTLAPQPGNSADLSAAASRE